MDPGSWNQCCSRVNCTQEVLRPDEVREFGFNVKFQMAVEVAGIRMQKQSPEVITEMENRSSGKRPSHGGKRVRRDLPTALGQSCRKWAKITASSDCQTGRNMEADVSPGRQCATLEENSLLLYCVWVLQRNLFSDWKLINQGWLWMRLFETADTKQISFKKQIKTFKLSRAEL